MSCRAIAHLCLSVDGIGQISVRIRDCGGIGDGVVIVFCGSAFKNSGRASGAFLDLEYAFAYADFGGFVPAANAEGAVRRECNLEPGLGLGLVRSVFLRAGCGDHRSCQHQQ